MDRSLVASAYAEVRADLSKLPADLVAVPGIIKRMISTDGLKAVRDILTGNITRGFTSIATQGYTLQAEKLRGLADQAMKTSQALAAMGNKSGAIAARNQGIKFGQQAQVVGEMGAKIGGMVGLASSVAVAAIGLVAAGAAAYFAATVAAAHKATANLKTEQLVRATGEAAGWTSKQLQFMAENLRKTTSFSASDISGAQQALLKHPNIKGDQFEKALKTATNISAVIGDELPHAAAELGSILAGLNDPMAVNGEMLAKYGVLLNGAEQGAIKNAIASRDWAKAQDLILDKLSKFDGMAQEAAETGVGGFDRLKESLLQAIVKVGGLTGDIGQLASGIAKAIDQFMGLTVVNDILDLLTAPWRLMTSLASEFFDGNTKDIQQWVELISESYHNVRDQVLQVWDTIKQVGLAVLKVLGDTFGVTFQDIKDYVTSFLNYWTMITADLRLSAEFVWVSMKIGFFSAWDSIRDQLAIMRTMFQATWDSVAAGASEMWRQVKGGFLAQDTMAIGNVMADAFKKSFSEGLKDANLGDSPEVKGLKRELYDIFAQMKAARDGIRDKRATDAAAKAAEEAKLKTPGKGTDYINTKPFKYEFSGFEELSKKIQTSLYPSEAIQLQRAGVAFAEKAVNNGDAANKKLDAIADGVKGGMGLKK